MPRQEIWVSIVNNQRTFTRAQYLDYLRTRRRYRLSQQRLARRRETACERLSLFRNTHSVEEMVDFLNRHSSDLAVLLGGQIVLRDFHISLHTPKYGVIGSLHYRYTRNETAFYERRKRQRVLETSYDIIERNHQDTFWPDHILADMGVILGSGSGQSDGMGNGHMKHQIRSLTGTSEVESISDRLAA